MSSLAKNVLFNLFGQGGVFVLGFLAVRNLFHTLGGDAVGIVYFAMAFGAILSVILDLGISSTVIREVSSRFRTEPEYIHRLMRTSTLFYWAGYFLLSVAIVLIAPVLVTRWVNLRSIESDVATMSIRVVGVGTVLALPRSLYASLFRGLQRMEVNNLIDVSMAALQQVGLIVILTRNAGLEQVSVWIATSNGLGILVYLTAARRFVPFGALVPGFHGDVVGRNAGYSLRMLSISLLSMIHTYADKLVASRLLPLGSFGAYGFGFSAVSRATILTGAISQASFPLLAELFSSGRRPEMMRQYRKLQDVLCFGTIPLFAAVPFFSRPAFSYVFGPELGEQLLLPLAFLALGFYMNGTIHVPYVFSLAVGRPGISAASNLLALFTVLPVTVLLVYVWGLNGAGLSWVVYHVFAYAYGVRRICIECLQIRPWSWYAHVIRWLALAAITYGPAWFAAAAIGGGAVWALIAAYAVASITYAAIATRLISSELRDSMAAFLKFRSA